MANSCIFCQICSGNENTRSSTRIIYEDELFVAFQDIKPAAKHHYLVIPKKHISDASKLKYEDIELIENMHAVGKKVITQEGGNCSSTRLGFHWPPACSVYHLHLHVICPISGIKNWARITGKYDPKRLWFRTPEWLIEHLQKQKEKKDLKRQQSGGNDRCTAS